MKIYLPLILLLAFWVMGCDSTLQPQTGGPRPATTLPSVDASLLEAAFRCALELAPKDKPIFISQSRIGEQVIDPPPGFLERLADLKLKLKPASAEEYLAMQGIYDRVTGEQGYLYWVVVKEHISGTKVRIELGNWYGPLDAMGQEIIFELINGKWVPAEFGRSWTS